MRRLRNTARCSWVKTFNIMALPLLASMLLIACSGTPSSLTYYLLHSPANSSNEEATATVVIDAVTLPEYLKQRGLVYQISDTNLHISTKHLWAEPIDEGLTKALKHALSKRGISLVPRDHYASQPSTKISLHINDFVSSHTGEVIFSGEYVISLSDNSIKHTPFHLRTTLPNDGFSSSIDAMREAIDELSAMIAKEVAQ